MARERYLINSGEDTIHSKPIVPTTAKEKRENWWFHYKWHTIGITLGAIFVFAVAFSIISKVEPDYTIALLTSYTMPTAGLEEIERCITPYADDRNGDGKVKVTVTNYTISTETATDYDAMQQQQAALTRFIADITVNESMIIIHDEAGFEAMQNEFTGFFLYNDGTTMAEDATDFENAMREWADFTAFDEFVPEAEEDATFSAETLDYIFRQLRVSVRAKEGTTIEKKQKYLDYYDDCLQLYSRLDSGTPYTASGE